MTPPPLMLATPTTLPRDVAARTMTATGLWAAELKLDGIRVCATVEGPQVTLTNRRGVNITYRYPELVEELASLGIDAVLDGEIIVYDKFGKPSFPLAHRRDAQSDRRAIDVLSKSIPATLVAFDLLFINGTDIRRLSYDKRRKRLEELGQLGVKVNVASEDGQALWDEIKLHNLEGLVLKRRDSTYQGGRRSPAWVKVKRVRRLTARVAGSDPGEGHRASTFGALHLVLIGDGGEFVPVGSVGTGFTNEDCRTIRGRLDRGDHPIVVEVEYLEVSPDGKLRQPSFKGVRTDVVPTDCTIKQLHVD